MATSHETKRLERLILGTAVVISVFLLFASIDNFFTSYRLAAPMVHGQVEQEFFGQVRHKCQPTPHDPSQTTQCLQAFLDKAYPRGLRYVAIALNLDHRQFSGLQSTDFVVEVGARTTPLSVDIDADYRGRPVAIGALFYYAMPPNVDHTQVPTLLFEFEPTNSNGMIFRGWVTLLSGLVGALVTLLGSFFLVRTARQRELADLRAKEKEKLAVVGQMSAVMAHEIRNPLAIAKGHTQLLAEMLEPGTRVQRKAEQSIEALLRVEHLTNDLLDFIRSGKVNRSSVDPVSLIQNSIDSLHSTTSILVESASAPGSWSLDPLAMERVLTNLLRNSLQAQSGSEPIEITVSQQEQQLVIAVRDRGPGFPPETDVLAPFVTTKPTGNGLGLSIVEQIIKAHQGKIALSNHPDGGAIVTLFIPS
jgi:signal transduction histidine kinase